MLVVKEATPDNQRLWRVSTQAEAELRPPYEPDFEVLPGSLYRFDTWFIPLNWLPAGSRNKEKLSFLSPAYINGVPIALSVSTDRLLIDQLKQVLCFMIIHGQILGKRLEISTIYGRLSGLRRLFITAKVAGLNSLSQINSETFPKLRAMFPARMPGEVSAGLHAIIKASQTGYVLDGLNYRDIEIPLEPEPWDTSQISGRQVLTDDEYDALVKKVDFIFDNYEEYKRIVGYAWRDQSYAMEVRKWLLPQFPGVGSKSQLCGLKQLSARLLQSASAFRLFFSTGIRPNELLSIRGGFLIRDLAGAHFSEQHITYEVVKNQLPGGISSSFPLDPIWEMDVVEDALQFVCNLYEKTDERLFTGPKIEGEFSTGHLGTNLKEFCRLAGIGFEATGYNIRSTLISHTAQTVAGGLTKAQLAMDHVSKRTTAGYALSSPSVRDDIYERCQEVFKDRTTTLVEAATSMGGPGLHGEQGRRIENDLARAMDASSGVISKEEVAHAFIEETASRNIYPLPVMPGVFCFKTPQGRGECSKASNDSLADVARCSPRCPYGVQLEYRKDIVRNEIDDIIPKLSSLSELQKRFWLRQIIDQLVAFPDLEPELKRALTDRPQLLSLIEELRSSK